MAVNTAYTPPGVSGTVSAVPQQSAISAGARRMALLGTAAKGPDVPTTFTNVAAALAAYGAIGSPGTLPWGIQCAMGTPTPGGTTAPLTVCRTGVTRASVALLDAGTAASLILLDASTVAVATVKSAGVTYGGSAGSGLTVTVTAGTSSGFKVQIKHSATILSTYDNLANGAAFVAAVAAAVSAGTEQNITATVGTSALVAANISATALAGGGASPAVVATIQGIGAYAGTAGANLTATVSAGTISGFKVVITDTALSATLATYDNLHTGSDFFNMAHNDTTIDVSLGASTQVAIAGAFALTGGADGLATVPGGSPDAVAAMLALLFSGIVTPPRYLCALWDASLVAADVTAALDAAASLSRPALCMAFLGSATSGTIGTNRTLASTLNHEKVWMWELPAGARFDDTIGATRAFDGFYVAATAMGMKAALPEQSSLINKSLPGWTGNANITVGGITRQPVLADVVAGGASGASYGLSGGSLSGLVIIDSLTTAPQTGASAYAAQPGMQDGLHSAQLTAYAAGASFTGQAAPGGVDQSNTIAGVIHGALQRLAGGAIHSVAGVSVAPDPTTLGRYIPQVAVNLSPTVRNLAFTFTVSSAR